MSISSDLVSEYREYERTLTAVLNSYTQPQVIKYVDGLESLLRAPGSRGRLNIVRSDGGTMSARSTKERPVDIAFSGPSGGAVGAAYLARRMGVPNVLTFDMGGTSTDVALCRDGEVAIKREAQLGYYQFQARGADIHSVGAGGGSIAYLNLAGALKVGPRSAGADPGPACYGRGGTEPTVTDANVVLGPPAGRLEARRAPRARRRRRRAGRGDGRRGPRHRHRRSRAGDHRHRQREHARRPARRVASSAATTRATSGSSPSAARGRCTPTRSRASSAPTRSIIPSTPGVLSAFGFLAADVQNEFARTYLRPAEETPGEDVRAAVDELIGEAGAWLDAEGVDAGDRVFDVFADCRYYRQDIQIPVRAGAHGADSTATPRGCAATSRASIAAATASTSRRTSRSPPCGWWAAARARHRAQGAPPPDRGGRRRPPPSGCTSTASGTTRRSTSARSSRRATPSRGRRSSSRRTATSVIEPGWTGTVDDAGNITFRRQR